ncbi:MAG: NlpC/P60 family protein [Spirochaetes bacterium]|nr:MAG: NlpC/P60 family protein [Spirochaetota bacterium]
MAREVMFKTIAASAVIAFLTSTSPHASADPADEVMARITALGRQAEQATEALYGAQLEWNSKVSEQRKALDEHTKADRELSAANDTLDTYRESVSRYAVAQYMSGNGGGLGSALLSASSPSQFVDKISTSKAVYDGFPVQMNKFREAAAQANDAEKRSAEAAEAAKEAENEARKSYTSMMQRRNALQSQISAAQAQYATLIAHQRARGDEGGDEVTELPPVQMDAVFAANPMPAANSLPEPPPVVPVANAVPAQSEGTPGVVQAAMSQIGSSYVWGGASPGGFDCSGLVMWAFKQNGKSLPHSSQALARGGTPVSLDDLQPGDLVTYYSDASHVSMYVGDGNVIHAPTFGQKVKVVPLAGSGPVYNARRY